MERIKLFLSFLLLLGLFALPSFAWELNSGNISNYCSSSDTYCFLRNEGIKTILPGTFENYTGLIRLDLRRNQISSIDGLFSGLTNLQELNLSFNSIKTIDSGTFLGLSGLKYLDLAKNNLISLEEGVFEGLNNLEELYLSENNLTELLEGVFQGLAKLTTLELFGNSIKTIEGGAFMGLNSLTELDLYDFGIENIERGAFVGLTNLVSLNLEDNNLIWLVEGTFEGLENLTELEIEDNPINNIDRGAFNGLGSLIYLSLANNNLTRLVEGTFEGLENLTELWLYGGFIDTIETGAFLGLDNLIDISIIYNNLSHIKSGMFFGLNSGVSLSLVHNKINKIDNWFLSGYKLNLESNCLDVENTGLLSYLDTIGARYKNQYVCLGLKYTPEIITTGLVTGSLYFTGPSSYVEVLSLENDLSIYDYAFLENGIHVYDYSGLLIDSNDYLGFKYDYRENYLQRITGEVTWIEVPDDIYPPIISGITNGRTYTTSVTFSISDNIGVTSVILDGKSLTERIDIKITEIGEHTLIAKDIANNAMIVIFTIKKKSSGGGGSGGGYEFSKEKLKTTPLSLAKGLNDIKEEMEKAYEYAKEKNITTTKDLEEFQPQSKLIRMHLAKMISEFAIEVMGKEEMKEGVAGCEKFEDMKGETEEMQKYVTIACKLGLMGRKADQKTVARNFNPTVEVNRAQFGTIFSRLLRGEQYVAKEGESYYVEHLKALKASGFMTMINPEMEELRGYVILMLYRVSYNG